MGDLLPSNHDTPDRQLASDNSEVECAFAGLPLWALARPLTRTNDVQRASYIEVSDTPMRIRPIAAIVRFLRELYEDLRDAGEPEARYVLPEQLKPGHLTLPRSRKSKPRQ